MTEQDDKQEQQEIGLYEKLAARTAELLESSRKGIDEALLKAREELSSAGDFSRGQAEKISGFIRRDISHLGNQALKTREALKKAVDPQRLGAGMQSTLARLMKSAAETLGELAEKTERQLEYHTGEVTSLGKLTCRNCGGEMHLTATVRIPPCPKCHKTVFRKSY